MFRCKDTTLGLTVYKQLLLLLLHNPRNVIRALPGKTCEPNGSRRVVLCKAPLLQKRGGLPRPSSVNVHFEPVTQN